MNVFSKWYWRTLCCAFAHKAIFIIWLQSRETRSCSTNCPFWGLERLQYLSYFLPTVNCQFYIWNIFAMCLLCPFPLLTLLIQFTFASRLDCCYNILPEYSALSQPSPSIFLGGIIRSSKFSTLIKSRPSLGCRFSVAFHQEERSLYSGFCHNLICGQAKAAPLPTWVFSHCSPCLPFCSLLLTQLRLGGLLSGFWGPDELKSNDSSLWGLCQQGTTLPSTECSGFYVVLIATLFMVSLTL